MPITQARMIGLLSEEEAILKERDSLRRECLRLTAEVTEGALSPQDALASLSTFLAFQQYTQAIVLALEQRHFSMEGKRNIRRKERERVKRAATGIPQAAQSTAPATLARELSLEDLQPQSEAEEYRLWREGEEPGSFIPD